MLFIETLMSKDATTLKQFAGYPLAFLTALASNTLFFSSFQALFPVLPRFIAEVVVNRPSNSVGSQVGLATAVLAIVSVLVRIPAGQSADRFGRRRFMLLGATCFIVAPLLHAISRGMPLLIVGRVVYGAGLATYTTAFQALVTDLAPAQRRGEALGLAGASLWVALIVAPPVGEWLATSWGYGPFFVASAATAALSMLLVFFIVVPVGKRIGTVGEVESGGVPENHSGPVSESAPWGLRAVLSQKGIRVGILTMAALGIPYGAFITFLPLLAEEQDVTSVGIVFSIYAATVLLVQPLSGRWSDRLGRSGPILSGLLVTTVATVILALGRSELVFVGAGIVWGLGGGLTRGGVDALVQDSVPAQLRGTAAAVQYTSFDFWIGLGSYPMGLLANVIGYAATFAVTGVVCLFGGGLAGVLLQRPQQGPH
jgi:MFS family permease